MALIDDFKAKFPEFDTAIVDDNFSSIEAMYPCLYGSTYGQNSCDDQRILFLLAHILTTMYVNTRMTPAFLSASRSVGPISTSLALSEMSNDDSWYLSTKYGQQFKMLTQFGFGALFV